MNTKKLISKSVDIKYFGTKLLWFACMCILFAILAIALRSANTSSSALFAATAFLLVFLIPVTVYYTVRIICLYRDIQDYHLYTAISKEVHNIDFLRTHYFVLEGNREDGSAFTVQSKGVFETGTMSNTYFGDYVNQPLQVLYNTKTESVIVVGKGSSSEA